jgi:signal transduction histidine kinase
VPVPPTRGNAAELREVLINLIMNAIAAMPAGGALTVRSFVAGQQVLVAVADTGEGIACEHQSAIFQPFVTMRTEGTGLGLSVSRAIVESYGGTLTVESAPGAGATFTLALPAIRSLDALYEAQSALCKPCVTVSGEQVKL